jgi:hypothetical protein
MKSYVATVKVVCHVVFEAKDEKHAEKIVNKETWDLFDDLNAKNDAIELEEIQETLSVYEQIEDFENE